MRAFLLGWVQTVMSLPIDRYGRVVGGFSINDELLQEFEMATRRRETLVDTLRQWGLDGLYKEMGPEEFLDFVDFLVFHAQRLGGEAASTLESLEIVLRDAGSEWKVGVRDGHASLEKRVPEGVATAVDETISGAGPAGSLLAEAWRAVFGRSPDPEDAYGKAIKAVEEAGAHVVSPKSGRTTLGTMVRDMEKQNDWSLDLPTPGSGVPVRMAAALWRGQGSRHGGNGYRKPTQAEAEAAVMLAVPLVQWFTSGALRRRTGQSERLEH